MELENAIELERMAMNKRVAEFKTHQAKDLQRFITTQQSTFDKFCHLTHYTHRPPVAVSAAMNDDQSMSLPRSGMFFMDDEVDDGLVDFDALGVLEDEYEPAADDAEEPVLESVPEEADEPAAAEDDAGGMIAKSLPMNIPMMGHRQRPVKTKLLMLD